MLICRAKPQGAAWVVRQMATNHRSSVAIANSCVTTSAARPSLPHNAAAEAPRQTITMIPG